MVFLAVSTLEKLKAIPADVWLKLAAAMLVVVIIVIALRKLAQMNKVILGAVVFIGGAFLFFSWIYERNEPAFLTPIVNKIAPFFPSKDSYGTKQKSTPKGSP
jgi:drug/metabolite transporter superfamily protein YnfA